MLERLPKLLKSLAPQNVDVVLILGGTNDMTSLEAEQIVSNLVALHEMAHGAGATTGVLSVPEARVGANLDVDPSPQKREKVNQALRDFALRHSQKCFFVDVAAAFPQTAATSELWDGDGLHFSEKGYMALGDLLAKAQLPKHRIPKIACSV
ncbi:unnamed protein product [Polarella glacialis]|uniref:SGNH hydrolase-type esterase domain-containing protein n=1 Tax=Polarella glacialis TaxID=89957 RepID=A0A813DQ84_POLGL|nr:unnamed protein product [Polarella glacialis]